MDKNIHFYCINLKHRTDRWNKFSSQPAIKEIKSKYMFERFDAVPGSTIDIQNDTRISLRTKRNISESTRRSHEDLNSAGGVGCYLSHVEIWKKIIINTDPFGIIFEDDTHLPNNFIELLNGCMNEFNLLPEMPDIWIFSNGWDFHYKTNGKDDPSTLAKNIRGPWIYNTCPGGLNGYFLTRKGAQKLLHHAFPIEMHVDLYICACVDLKRVVCVSHKKLLLNLLVESNKSDIQPFAQPCLICNIPTNYHEKGMLFINIPYIIIVSSIFLGLVLLNISKRK